MAKSPSPPLNRRALLPNARLLALTAVIAAVSAGMSALSSPPALRIDGERVVSDVPPVTTSTKDAYVPLRAVADVLGAETNYDAKSGQIELVRANDTLRLRIGDHHATFNGRSMTLGHAPFAVRGRTMVALGVVAKAFGTRVRYDGAHAKIDVMTPGLVEAGAQDDSP